jgi:cyanophycin synthetase
VAGIGDRREEDNMEIGRIAGEMFDEIIIRQDKHLRGKTEQELIKMVKDGILKDFPKKKITVIPSEKEAIHYAVDNAIEGTLIVLCSDVVPDALDLVKDLKKKEAEGEKIYN